MLLYRTGLYLAYKTVVIMQVKYVFTRKYDKQVVFVES